MGDGVATRATGSPPRSARRRRWPIERREGYWLWLGGPVVPGASALTLGSLILMRRRAAGNARLLRHELVHVRQWREDGYVGFARRYLASYARWRLRGYPHWAAYRRIGYEAEAEWLARRHEHP